MAKITEDRILDRVRSLLAIAEHPNTGEHEREVALNQANSLMTKHAIDEALARAEQSPAERAKVEILEFRMIPEGSDSEIWSYMRSVLSVLSETNRCRAVIRYESGSPIAKVYGMHDDLGWVEMLYTTVYFEMVSRVNPRWDSARGYDANVYTFKVAGYKWAEINRIAIAHDDRDARVWENRYVSIWEDKNLARNYDEQTRCGEMPTDKISGIMIAAYKREAKRLGDTLRVDSSNPDHYRRQFIDAFTDRIVARLRAMARENAETTDSTPGAALALRDMAAEIRDALYADHPHLSPEYARQARIAAEERRQEMLDAMSPAKRAKFLEKEEREQRRNNAAWEREQERKTYDYTAQRMGRAAADTVNLNKGHKVQHDSRKEIYG